MGCVNSSSGNMKSAVFSSSSGSKKVGGGVASSVSSDLDDSKANSTSRMSCASDDSCAINELLEGRMDLNVNLPNSNNFVVFNVERRTPMLDLLVNIATQYRFNAANYTINAGDHEFKASTPIGSLDVNQISIIPKTPKSAPIKSGPSSQMPFQATFRLQVNLPRNQLMVLRVTPNASIAAIKNIICSEKSLDSSKYQLVRFAGNSEAPQILDTANTLEFYSLTEVTLISNKSLSQIEMQYSSSSVSHVERSNSTNITTNSSPTNKNAIISLIVSQSNPDFATIDDRTALQHSSSIKTVKKRPAPLPPKQTLTDTQNIKNLNDNHSNNSNLTKQQKVDEYTNNKIRSQEILTEAKLVPNTSKMQVTNHVRQNSGSDSSGYHESVLSSDSPESSSAVATLPKSSSTAINDNKQLMKKRKAPPPPPLTQLSTANNKESEKNAIKAALECMSDVSLPLSSASSSTSEEMCTASSINNRSLSPIIITKTNGSTPQQISTESVQTPTKPPISSRSITKNSNEFAAKNVSEQLSEMAIMGEVPVLNENLVNSDECVSSTQQSLEPIMCQQNDSNVKVSNENNDKHVETSDSKISLNASICNTNRELSDSEAVTKSDTVIALSNDVVVDVVESVAPALSHSHDNDHTGHENVEQLLRERDQNNAIVNETQGLPAMLVISPPLQFQDHICYNNVVMDAYNCLHSANNGDGSGSGSGSSFKNNISPLRKYLMLSRSAYLHSMKGIKDIDQPPHYNLAESKMTATNTVEYSDISQIQNISDCEISESEMSLPLPPPSPFQNSNYGDHNSPVNECDDDTDQHVQQNSDLHDSDVSSNTIKSNQTVNQFVENYQTNAESITIETMNKIIESESETTTTTTPLIVSDEDNEDKLNKEIEVTLQSFNDELDKLDYKEECDTNEIINEQYSPFNDKYEHNFIVNDRKDETSNTHNVNKNTANSVSVRVKQLNIKSTEIEAIKNMLEKRETISPTPRVTSVNGKSKITLNKEDSNVHVSKQLNGKTTVTVNKKDSPVSPPLSPQPVSPTPSEESKLSADEVRQLCRPRVKLTNFTIGSYKKEVDIFEETPRVSKKDVAVTAPVIKANEKPVFATFKSFPETMPLKSNNIVSPTNENKPKINIISATTSNEEQSSPVIQKLITAAPKINRIQSWSGAKSYSLDRRHFNQPLKTNERHVSQIDINKDSMNVSVKNSASPLKTSSDPKSPPIIVKSIVAKTESTIKNRSPSPQEEVKIGKEPTTTISIKQTPLASHPKQVTEITVGDNRHKTTDENFPNRQQSVNGKTRTNVQLISDQCLPPPPPPPPIQIESNIKVRPQIGSIFHPKGWKSEKPTRNGSNVPKVKHVEPPNNSVNVRDALLTEIKSFGGKGSLKKVSKNSSWQLEIHGNSLKT